MSCLVIQRTLKWGHIRQVVDKYRFPLICVVERYSTSFDMHCIWANRYDWVFLLF